MKILFDAFECGLGNNGGTKTIIRSAETLNSLGYQADILAEVNKYKLTKHNLNITNNNSEKYDYIVSVSAWDLNHTLHCKDVKKVWWCRGWENWICGDSWFAYKAKDFVENGGHIIVNSSWLIDKFKTTINYEPVLCYSGLDLDIWETYSLRSEVVTVGALYHHKHKTKGNNFIDEIINRTSNYKNIKFEILYSNDDFGYKELIKLYNKCDIWLSTSILEGFHNVPAEANLCGCLVLFNNVIGNGVADYANEKTGMQYTGIDQAISHIKNPDYNLIENMQEVLKNKIGDREKNMKKFVSILSEL